MRARPFRSKTAVIAVAVAGTLAGAETSSAAYITGSFGVFFNGDPGTYTGPDLGDATSVYFNDDIELKSGATGAFSAYQKHDLVTVLNLPIPAPTATPTTYPDSVPAYMTFSSSDAYRYSFDLSSVTEYYSGGVLNIYGYGTLNDTQGVYSATPAEFTANVSGDLGSSGGNGTFSAGSFTFAALAPVPEPAGLTLVAAAAAVSLRRRRKSA